MSKKIFPRKPCGTTVCGFSSHHSLFKGFFFKRIGAATYESKFCLHDIFLCHSRFPKTGKADANGWFIASVTDEAAFAAQNPVDRSGVPVDDPLKSQIATVVSKMRPVCVAADGLPVCDDIGGIDGYCDFLVSIHGMDSESVYDSREESLDWARGQGWTGRMNRPQNIL